MPDRARNVARHLVASARRAAGVGEPTLPAKSPAPQRAANRGKRTPQPSGAPLVDLLSAGAPLEAAVIGQIRADLAERDLARASALAGSLAHHPQTRELGLLAQAVVTADRGFLPLAHETFSRVPEALWTTYAVDEFVRTGMEIDPETTLAVIRELVGRTPAPLSASGWLALLGPMFGYRHHELARAIYERLDEAVNELADPGDLAIQRDWLRSWVSADGDSPSAEPPASGVVSFAVMDYGHPGRNRASANIGDHVQSLASLGHLARHQQLRFQGDAELVELLEQLQARVRPDVAETAVAADVNLLAVDRDASMFRAVPPNTWTLGFGWFMHPMFGIRYGMPFHDNLLPIIVSFHCNHRGLLTPEVIDYLRRFGPVGCRDWTTVDIMLSVGVPAFFSGCLTTTVGTVFPELVNRPGKSAPVAYVDVPSEDVPVGAPTYRHSYDAVRFRSFATNVYDAIELLETYRRKHSGLVTSRLHCYLPGRAIGVPVDFQPKNRSDIRFAGLIDINESQFNAIRDGINDKLRRVLGAAFSGEEPEAVYALWRELTAPDVEAARQRHHAPPRMAPARADLSGHLANAVGKTLGATPDPDALQFVVVVPRGQSAGAQLPVLLASVKRNASRPVHAWLVGRDSTTALLAAAEQVPGLRASAVSTRGLSGPLRRVDGGKPSAFDVDVLALPELLPDADRIVVVPIDAVVTGDLAQLHDLDLGEFLLAAPDVASSRAGSGFAALHAAGNRLRGETVAAAELRRQGHGRHKFDFDAFDTSVLVLDLAGLRATDMVAWCIPYIEQFGLNLRELMFLRFGPNRAVVPARWHAVPGCTLLEDAALLHWSEPNQPWSAAVSPGQDLWREAARAEATSA